MEVRRLVGLGARTVDWDLYPPEPDFVVLAGPDGNIFCVVDLSHAPSGGHDSARNRPLRPRRPHRPRCNRRRPDVGGARKPSAMPIVQELDEADSASQGGRAAAGSVRATSWRG